MITAEEFLKQHHFKGTEKEDILIEFAKMHVTEALKQASEKARTQKQGNSGSWFDASIKKQSILTAYSLDNIK